MTSHLRRQRGLTLIELIVVMAILVILAGLTLPKLDVFKLKANKAQAASNMASLVTAITSYRAQHDVYPDYWDSLIEDQTSTLFSELHPSLNGGVGGTATKAATTTLTAGELQSLARVGVFNVVDHVAGTGFPNNSATVERALTTGATVATLNLSDSTGKVAKILQEFYPAHSGTVPNGKKVVVFAIGKRSTMVGDVIVAPPFYANANQLTQYARMLAVFEVDGGGSRAKLLGCLAADGDRFEGEIQDFYKN